MTRYAKTMSQALAEMKMNDPKLNKIFDKLKKGDKIKLKTSSVASRGSDFVEYIVKSKNVVNKGRVEKITLATVGNEKAVKKFLYRRDGKVTFAMGDMAASIDDIKEEIEEGTWKYAETPAEIAALKKLMSRPLLFGKDGENATRQLLHESFPPTAILYATDVAALGAYKVASDLGLQIGKELSIISYDGVPEGSFANPPLTTFKIDTKKAGEQLAALLIKRVNGEAVELLRETDPAILYPGESDGSPTVSSKELSCLLEEAKIVKT